MTAEASTIVGAQAPPTRGKAMASGHWRVQARPIVLRALVYGVPCALILLPFASFLLYAFVPSQGGDGGTVGFANFTRFLSNDSYRGVFWATLRLAATVGVFGLLLGYVVAYVIWRMTSRLRELLLLAAVLPLAMNYVVKIYAMRGILGFNGFANQILIWSGLLTVPTRWLVFNQTAVLITMTVLYVPYAILPVFLSLERIPASLVHAAADLGGKPWHVFRHVVLPLSLPGAVVGALFVMVFALGDYLTPQMVGGPQGFTFGRAIWSQFGMAFDWSFGAALSLILLAVVLVVLALAGLVARHARVQ